MLFVGVGRGERSWPSVECRRKRFRSQLRSEETIAPSLEGHHVGQNRLGAASLVPCRRLVPPTTLLGIAGGPVACVGIAVALVGEVVAVVGGPLAGVGVVLGPVQGGGASGQPGLGGL